MGVVEAPETVDWAAIIQFFKDLHEQVKKTPLSRPSRSRGLPVRLVQGKLVERGFNPGPVDGVYGKKTGDAIRAFQETQGFLKVTGVVNGETFGCLFIQ
jgi:peptidoglycan hydrolase-like protein with peptidoglycan-binding domain